jgi:glucose-1-phosphate thymidylyltransferase
MKGIVLAGGSGTRLYPMTSVLNKHLLPIYDKPMIYYPLSVLMMPGIRDILIISTPEDTPNFRTLLGDGARFGIKLSYKTQPSPDGLAQAFILGKEFVGKDDVAMILGDNVLFGSGLKEKLGKAVSNLGNGKATIFGFHVKDPERFGVIEFSKDGNVLSVEEKPKQPKSSYAAIGLYFYDNRVIEFAAKVRPSWRNELEITEVNNMYREEGDLEAIALGRGFTWIDAGTPESMAEASNFIRMIENHQGLKVACLEEIAYTNGWVSRESLEELGKKYSKNEYGKYILKVLEGRINY